MQVDFVIKILKEEYLIHYINTIQPKKEGLWSTDYLEGYNEFFKGIKLELFEDIYIFNSNTVQDCDQVKIADGDAIIGIPTNYFPEHFSLIRQQIELYNFLIGVDIVRETDDGLSDIKLVSLNIKEE